MNDRENIKGYIYVAVAGVLWGTIGPFFQTLENMGSDVFLTSLLRLFFAFLIMLLLTIGKFGADALKISKKAIVACGVMGILCHAGCYITYGVAVLETGVSVGAILLATAPVFTAAASRIIFREKMTRRKITALLINIFGCMLAATGGELDLSKLSVFGILCGLGAGFTYGMTPIVGRLAGQQTDPYVANTYAYLFGSMALVLLIRPSEYAGVITPSFLLVALGFAIIPTSIAYLLYLKGVQVITESSKVPVVASTETVSAILFGILLYQETLNAISIAGIVLVMSSILLMNEKTKRA